MKKFRKSMIVIVSGLLLATPVLAQTTVDNVTSKHTVVKKVVKTTSLKNPVIIDGVAYGDAEFIKRAFDIRFVNEGQIVREDKGIQFIVDKVYESFPRVDWSYAGDKNVIAKTVNGKIMYPLKFIASHMNSEIRYDAKTKILTVDNYGLEEIATTDEEFVTIKGKVIGFDGEPAEGITVELREPGSIVYKDILKSVEGERCKGDGVPVTYTDAEGRYEFRNIDTKLLPRVSVSVQHAQYKGIDVSGASVGNEMNPDSLKTHTQDKELQLHNFNIYGLRGRYSNRLEMPTIFLYRK